MTSKERKAKSPYQKYGKSEHRYSADIYAMQRAVRNGHTAEYRRLNDAFWVRLEPEFRRWRKANGVEDHRPARGLWATAA